MLLESGLGNVIEITSAGFRAEIDVTRGFFDRLETDTLVLDKLHRNLRNSPHDDVRSRNLRDRVVAILREPLRIESLSALVIQDVLEPVLLQEPHGVFEFGGQAGVFAAKNRIDVLLQQNLEKRLRSAARAGTQSAGDFRRQVAQDRNDAVGITCERFKEVAV